MQHGLIDSSDVWILNYRNKAPAFVAADAGFDIWLPNHRGNKYSKDHLKLDSTLDAEYWHHSFPEFAKFDMPAFFKYIKNQTGVEKLTYVGHSQGTIEMFYAMATNPQFIHDNVNLFVGLGPFATLTNSSPMSQIVARIVNQIIESLEQLKIFDIFAPHQQGEFFQQTCGHFPEFCIFMMHFAAASFTKPLNKNRFRSFMGHYPGGSSMRCVAHFG